MAERGRAAVEEVEHVEKKAEMGLEEGDEDEEKFAAWKKFQAQEKFHVQEKWCGSGREGGEGRERRAVAVVYRR